MQQQAFMTIVLILATCVVSYQAFTNYSLRARFRFNVGAIQRDREWYRIFTSGFLHAGWGHLLVNMISLYFAGRSLEFRYGLLFGSGPLMLLLVYFGSMLGGGLLAWFLHRRDPGYSAVGASGAVSGLLFALAVTFPNESVRLFFILPIPFWLFAILFIAYSLFGMRANMDNIGHEAHLGGAITGILFACLLTPAIISQSWWLILLLLAPSVFLIYMIHKDPTFLSNPRFNFNFNRGGATHENRAKPKGLGRSTRTEMQWELDRLLDKISRKGLNGLSKEERARLEELRAKLHDSGGGHRAPRQ